MTGTKAASELSIIPRWAWVLAAVVFAVCLLVWGFFASAAVREGETGAGSLFFLGMGFFLGWLLAAVVLLTGYVNRDAKRRGMNVVLWTILVLAIPHAIGFIVYFLVRQPLRTPCPGCGAPVAAGVSYCASCGLKLEPPPSTAARGTP